MSIKPLHDRVTIRRNDAEKVSAGGIIIADDAQEKPSEGEVIAVGPGAMDSKGNRIPMPVKPGDKVLFGKWAGTEIKIDGEPLLVVKESEIFGVFE